MERKHRENMEFPFLSKFHVCFRVAGTAEYLVVIHPDSQPWLRSSRGDNPESLVGLRMIPCMGPINTIYN